MKVIIQNNICDLSLAWSIDQLPKNLSTNPSFYIRFLSGVDISIQFSFAAFLKDKGKIEDNGKIWVQVWLFKDSHPTEYEILIKEFWDKVRKLHDEIILQWTKIPKEALPTFNL
jgi:hypothetical protein